MKSQIQINQQARKLHRVAANESLPRDIRNLAWQAWHALRWAVEDEWTAPAKMLEREADRGE